MNRQFIVLLCIGGAVVTGCVDLQTTDSTTGAGGMDTSGSSSSSSGTGGGLGGSGGAGSVCEPGPGHYGWDYNLVHRCVESPGPSSTNFYSDMIGCSDKNRRWIVAIQSETMLGMSCVGSAGQSLPINQDGLLSLNWLAHKDECGGLNWSVNLVTDLVTKTHPCGDNTYNWYVLMDHEGYGGGPFPRPDDLRLSVSMSYASSRPNGAGRVFVGATANWDGKPRFIELNLLLEGWGDAVPAEPSIISVVDNPDFQFVAMDGAPLGYSLVPGIATSLTVDWPALFQHVVTKGYFDAPADWANSTTTTVVVGTEAHAITKTGAVKTDLWVTNFRVSSISGQ